MHAITVASSSRQGQLEGVDIEMKALFITLMLISIGHCCWADSISKVAIDIGHSKPYPGVISARGKSEFEFNVGLARVLEDVLTAHHIKSFFIGEDGEMVDVKQRTSIANTKGASFFISIHHDSVQPKYLKTWKWQEIDRSYSDNFSGFSLFVSRKNPQLKKSLHCAQLIGKYLKQNGFSSSNHHAESIPGESRVWADSNAGVYYYDDLIVLKTSKVPAVLVEAGVIVNRYEEQNIQKDSTRNLIAMAITHGLINCKGFM
jgi:N-acetylmuramoyl-L-alanine amidase